MREELYKQHILDHATHPRNKRALDHATHTGKGANASCGDSLTLYLAVDGGRIDVVSFEGAGCAISQAGASMLTEKLTGMTQRDAQRLTEQAMYDLLGIEITVARRDCALLAYRALKNALDSRL